MTASSPPVDPPGAPSPTQPLAGVRVQVVDDDALSRRHLQVVLAHHGCRVQTSADPASARLALLAEPPDVVLLDLRMPGEDGYSLLAWMRQQPTLATVPAICVTASVPTSEQGRVRAAGFAAFVPKPISPPQKLLDALVAVLRGQGPAGGGAP